jgi:DNA-binding PadR family transcriptional regulator
MLSIALILIILIDEELSAEEIRLAVKKRYGVLIGKFTLYLILGQLERKGTISSRWSWPYKVSGMKRRRLYKRLKKPP